MYIIKNMKIIQTLVLVKFKIDREYNIYTEASPHYVAIKKDEIPKKENQYSECLFNVVEESYKQKNIEDTPLVIIG